MHYDIAPDGRELALTVDPAAEPGMMHRCDIVVVNLATRRTKNLTSGSGFSDEHPCYSPDGRHIAYHAYDTARAFNDQGHLRVLTRKTGESVRIAPAFDRATTDLQWTPDSGALLSLTEDRGRVGVWRHALGDAMPVELVHGGVVSAFAQSRGGDVLVYARDTAQYPPALFASAGDGRGERAIETHNRALLARHALGEMREFTIDGFDGEPVQMLVTYPPGFDPKRKWPLMHSIHGGPHAAHHDGWHFRWIELCCHSDRAFGKRAVRLRERSFHWGIVAKDRSIRVGAPGDFVLDEVGDIPLELQPKLLRALQEKSFERLGGTRTIPIDVRLLAATNRNLTQMMGDKLFRSDLYYRLKVFPITTPPLRDHPEDIPLLARHSTKKYAAKMDRRD